MTKIRLILASLLMTVGVLALSAAPAFASGKPFLETKPATGVGRTTATLHGVVNPNGAETEYWFEYGEKGKLTSKTTKTGAGSGETNLKESATVTGLAPGETYYYRVVAKNVNGISEGLEEPFTTAAPGLPSFTLGEGETFPVTLERSQPGQWTKLGVPGETITCIGMKSKGSITGPDALSLTIELEHCGKSGSECSTAGAASGVEVFSVTGSPAYIGGAEQAAGARFTLAATVAITCGKSSEVKVQGSFLAPVMPVNTKTSELELSVQGNGFGEGVPRYTAYKNEKGEAEKAKLEANFGTGYKESALEAVSEYVRLTTGEALTFTATLPPENTHLPVISPATPVQGTPESATTGVWNNEPTGYAHQWRRCNVGGEACENIAGATSSTYTPVAEDVGHTLIVEQTAENEAGTGSAYSPPTSEVEKTLTLPKFILGEGEAFPVAVELSEPGQWTKIGVTGETITCTGLKLKGAITAAKALSLTVEVEHCNKSGSECKTAGAASGVDVFSATGVPFYISKAEKQVGIRFTLGATVTITCGKSSEAKVRGSFLVPVTPVNTKASDFELLIHGNGFGEGVPTYTTYENEKGEAEKVELEGNFGAGYKESAFEAVTEYTILIAANPLTIDG
jgi:hypothetical protein